MRPLLLVRPEPGLSASIARARALGIDVTGMPLFEVAPVAWTPPPADQFDAILLTSANAVRYGGSALEAFAHLPVHAVGAATADAAKEVGFQVTSIGGSGVATLLETLPPGLRLFCPGGRHRTAISADASITEVVVYEAVPTDPVSLPDMSGWVIAVHSPRAGRRLAELVRHRTDVAVAAISQPTADACGEGWQSIQVADRPDDESLLALAAKLCHTDRP